MTREHRLSVQPHHDRGNNHEQPGIVGLCIRPQGIDQLQVEKRREQDTAARTVEQRGHDDAQGHGAHEERRQRPGALRCAAEHKGRQVPDRPDNSEQESSPNGRHTTLKQGRASPRQPISSIGPLMAMRESADR